MATFTLAHMSCAGAWAWGTVPGRLRAAGHDVVAPDLTLVAGATQESHARERAPWGYRKSPRAAQWAPLLLTHHCMERAGPGTAPQRVLVLGEGGAVRAPGTRLLAATMARRPMRVRRYAVPVEGEGSPPPSPRASAPVSAAPAVPAGSSAGL